MGTTPTHYLTMKSRSRDVKNGRRIASIWQNPEGHFSMILDVGVSISWRDMEDSILTIFPSEREEETQDNITRLTERRKK